MKITPEHNDKIAKLTFSGVYPLYLVKIEKKERTQAELDTVIEWLTGFNKKKIKEFLKEKVTFEEFFK